MQQLLSSKFQLGADASAAAGPVGRHASADTDWKMDAEILTYSRAKGAFAGLTLTGASIRRDDHSMKAIYGPNAAASGQSEALVEGSLFTVERKARHAIDLLVRAGHKFPSIERQPELRGIPSGSHKLPASARERSIEGCV
jgi:hypothetical protein